MALAYTGWGDFFVLAGFGVTAMGMTTYLQTGIFYKEAFLFGLAPGALATAILTVNNLRDYEVDRSANKRTLIVRFGREFGRSRVCDHAPSSPSSPSYVSFCFWVFLEA
jgi:1,4-dihydroxy-2-naphthoate octaprenyltransferase